ncbi:hypothetical protein [Nocardia tengchongensis]|uniref:hypothetical protein n=1 Tax=Nocardia tengchongensis TaxID=2055889 RepID=UPI00364C57D4
MHSPRRLSPIYAAAFLSAGGSLTLLTWALMLNTSTAVPLFTAGSIGGVAALFYLSERFDRVPHALYWAAAPVAGQSWGLAFGLQLLCNAQAPRLSGAAILGGLAYGLVATALVSAALHTRWTGGDRARA